MTEGELADAAACGAGLEKGASGKSQVRNSKFHTRQKTVDVETVVGVFSKFFPSFATRVMVIVVTCLFIAYQSRCNAAPLSAGAQRLLLSCIAAAATC